jgi:uncharacterized protein (TIGR02118 family)
MHKLLLLLKRRPDISPEAFRAYYEGSHAPLCMKYMAGVDRYVRRYLDPAPGTPEPEYDVITEVWFKDRATLDIVLRNAAKDAMPADVIADEARLFDRSKSRFCAVTECETGMRA